MNWLYSFLLPSLLFVSLQAQDGPYQPEGKLPEGFSFKKCNNDDKDCLDARSSFMKQYNEYIASNNSNTLVSIVCNKPMIISQDENGYDIKIIVKGDR